MVQEVLSCHDYPSLLLVLAILEVQVVQWGPGSRRTVGQSFVSANSYVLFDHLLLDLLELLRIPVLHLAQVVQAHPAVRTCIASNSIIASVLQLCTVYEPIIICYYTASLCPYRRSYRSCLSFRSLLSFNTLWSGRS